MMFIRFILFLDLIRLSSLPFFGEERGFNGQASIGFRDGILYRSWCRVAGNKVIRLGKGQALAAGLLRLSRGNKVLRSSEVYWAFVVYVSGQRMPSLPSLRWCTILIAGAFIGCRDGILFMSGDIQLSTLYLFRRDDILFLHQGNQENQASDSLGAAVLENGDFVCCG